MKFLDRFLSMLTSAYVRTDIGQVPQTNIGKLFSYQMALYDYIDDQMDMIVAWEDLDLAVGATLDLFGQNVGVERGGMDDAAYRIAITLYF